MRRAATVGTLGPYILCAGQCCTYPVTIPQKSFTQLFRFAGLTWLPADKSAVLAPCYTTLGPSVKLGIVYICHNLP